MASPVAVLVAPYAPGWPTANLGAAKKIELVAGLLRRMDFDVHLVDSSHPESRFAPPIVAQRQRLDEHDVTLWRPFSLPSRKVGKLANVYFSDGLFRRIAALAPALVWLYNSYSFEARLGLYLRRHTSCRMVLELEDLPRARKRGLNPKPLLDQMFFADLLREADLITYVNASLRTRFRGRTQGNDFLFPSILKSELVAPAPRDRFRGDRRSVGYFGGLEPDKGARVLIDALPLLPDSWQLVVTGAGTLEPAFRDAQAKFPSRLAFHGRVSHARVAELMHSCDAIVNPHTSIADMRDGVFPFKVCEAIASGALVISTALPPIDVPLSRAVCSFDGTAFGLRAALEGARPFYEERRAEVAALRAAVCERYGEEAVLRALRGAIGSLSELPKTALSAGVS